MHINKKTGKLDKFAVVVSVENGNEKGFTGIAIANMLISKGILSYVIRHERV